MTGRDLIVYILTNRLEDEDVFENGIFVGLEHEAKYAEKLDVGVETVRAMIMLNLIDAVRIGDTYYIWDSTLTNSERKEQK